MILDIKSPSEPLLRQELADFDFKNPPCDPVELSNNLIETMRASNGLGLSANQCGLPHRVFVLWSEKPLVCFNPRIIDQTSEMVLLDEGCLTFPHLFIKIKRPKMIKVRYQDAFGETHTQKMIGMTARAFLHEMDHLDGIVFHKRASGPHLSRALNQQKILERRLKRGEIRLKSPEIPTSAELPSADTGTLNINTTNRTFTLA